MASTRQVAGASRDPAQRLPVYIPVRRRGASETHQLPFGFRNPATGVVEQQKSFVHGRLPESAPRTRRGTNLDPEQPELPKVRQE